MTTSPDTTSIDTDCFVHASIHCKQTTDPSQPVIVVQSAFKRQVPSYEVTAPAVMPEWENVKTEDKTLIYQVNTLPCLHLLHPKL